MRTLTRDTQSGLTHDLVEDIAIKLSATMKRLSLIESHVAAFKPRPPITTPAPRQRAINASGNDYWRDSTNTLSEENANLTQQLSKLREEYKQLKHVVVRCTQRDFPPLNHTARPSHHTKAACASKILNYATGHTDKRRSILVSDMPIHGSTVRSTDC